MRCLLPLVLVACSFPHGSSSRDDGGGSDVIDVMIDVMPDGFDPKCFGKAPFTVCLGAEPTSTISLPSNINTNDSGSGNCGSIGGEVRMVSGVDTCVLAGTGVDIAGTVVGVSGSRPLVVVSSGDITVSTLNFDITSGEGGDGPNANPTDCPAPADGVTGNMGGAGGGAGGSFGSKGGDGGAGGSGTFGGGAANPALAQVTKLRGGCPGGSGGAGNSTTAGGGSGGGAVYLVARGKLTITGKINASGAGGTGGQGSRGGGGGGGSGGMIVLHAAMLEIGAAARIFANGGGGGGGAGNSATDGGRGDDGLFPETPALGGLAGDTQGTAGGDGGFKSTQAESAAQAAHGGGGGGGAVGVIRVLSGQTIPAINVSPTPVN